MEVYDPARSIIFESIVLVIYLCFQIYFLSDNQCKIKSELTDMLINSTNLLNFLQGVCQSNKNELYFASLITNLHNLFF